LWRFLDRLDTALTHADTEAEVVERCLTQVLDFLPAAGVAIQRAAGATSAPTPIGSPLGLDGGAAAGWHARGRCPLSPALAENLAEVLQVADLPRPVIVNRMISQSRSWPYPEVRQGLVRAIRQGRRVWGYLSLYNHFADAEFEGAQADWVEATARTLESHLGRVAQLQRQYEVAADLAAALLRVLESRDEVTYRHSLRVAGLACRLASSLGCSATQQRDIYLGGLLHDVGKLALDRDLLEKSQELSVDELQQLRQHPSLGYEMLQSLLPLAVVLSIVRQHHEQPDGGGYPLGLQLPQISLGARIVAVADSYDALTHDRPYRPGCSHEQALLILADGGGQQWDREVVEALLTMAPPGDAPESSIPWAPLGATVE
jgi:putative nucleotidyltransferase with HDIG domain